MPTYISMLNWSGCPPPAAGDVRAAIARQSLALRRRGLHSVAFLPDEGECAAVMVATVDFEADVAALARDIYPAADVRVETTRFDDDPGERERADRTAPPPPPRAYRRRLLEAIAAP
jgi:hypothetical protein